MFLQSRTLLLLAHGSPCIMLDDDSFNIVGNHLGGGLYAPTASNSPPNYNLVMTVDHPEWVAKYAKYVVPTLPPTPVAPVRAYLKKHEAFINANNLLTPEVHRIIKD